MMYREYTLNGGHCYREIPTVLAVPILYNTSGSTYDILADETSYLVSATLAVHTIQALFQEDDKDILGLTYEEEIRTEDRESKGLTMSERVGIGVGAAIGGLLLIGIGVFLYLRRRGKDQKKFVPHEMEAVGGSVTLAPGASVGVAQHPPLSPYGGAPIAASLADDDSGHDDAFDGEIEVLKAQKAAIQRRIEELESVETPTDLGRENTDKRI